MYVIYIHTHFSHSSLCSQLQKYIEAGEWQEIHVGHDGARLLADIERKQAQTFLQRTKKRRAAAEDRGAPTENDKTIITRGETKATR